ncbi:MAG TPA: winged helix DNA-binding domain-containing protein [Acidimicrobiales bacterium]|nr:winged helix DNA-binding domain-containing protein [Acidimicrobiales bacterium]
MAGLTWDQVLGWRVGRHGLARPIGDAVEVTAALAGVQAQVASSARQVVAIRGTGNPGGGPVDLDRLLWHDRALVKTWAMRGTLHLLPAAEWHEWVALVGTREWRITPGWVRYHGITRDELDAITAAVPAALAGDPLTRDELADRVAALTGLGHVGEQLRSGWSAVFKPAASRGLLCQGPPRDGNVTFTDPRAWLGLDGAAPDPETAQAAVLGRFLDAYGPATRDDLARWLGVTPRAARLLLAAHAGAFVEVEVEGHTAWMTPSGARAAAAADPAEGVYLLPGFDPYVLAPISHRARTVPEARVDAVSRAAGWISPVLLVDGRVAGTWEPSSAGGTTTVTVTPFASLPGAVVAAARAHLEQRYAGVLGERLRLVVA